MRYFNEQITNIKENFCFNRIFVVINNYHAIFYFPLFDT